MRISEDKQSATLEIEGTYSAAELESLIAALAAVRAAMDPAVSAKPPPSNQAEDSAFARASGDPFVQVAVMRDGVTRFWVRHQGLGWYGFNLPVDRARALAQHILEVTARQQVPSALFNRKRRLSDPSH